MAYGNESDPTDREIIERVNARALSRTTGSAPAPARPTIHDALNNQLEMLAAARKAVIRLEEKFSSVLGPIPASSVADERADEPQSVRERIMWHTRALEQVVSHAIQLEQRAEL